MPRDLTVMLCAVPQAHQAFAVFVIERGTQLVKK
jgi:hypothetical protein